MSGVERVAIEGAAPGVALSLGLRRFGAPGARPKVHVQAGLHAGEVPGMLCAHHLIGLLEVEAAARRVAGEVVVVPLANPLGLSQCVLGAGIGRFDLADGANFNRGFPALGQGAAAAVAGRLGNDAADNAEVVRAALRGAVGALPATTPAEHLKRALLRLAIDADAVLDLHCDGLAVMHLYGLTPQAEALDPLARLLGAEAVLLSTLSGDDPFDEACSRPWLDVAARHAGHPLGPGPLAVTVELRGAGDVDHVLARRDARALLDFLVHVGALEGTAPVLPPARCAATDLAAVDVLTAPHAGVVAHLRAPGDRVGAGEAVAEVIDPLSGRATPVRTEAPGVLFALAAARFARAGQRLGKVAGAEPTRAGRLLSP